MVHEIRSYPEVKAKDGNQAPEFAEWIGTGPIQRHGMELEPVTTNNLCAWTIWGRDMNLMSGRLRRQGNG